jgi:diguanylate cyclase (GGDEF)-like protein
MTTFFARTDTQGVVQQTYWSNPISLALPNKTILQDLVASSDRTQFQTLFSKVLETEQLVFCAHLNLQELSERLCFYTLRLEQDVWVLAVDYAVDLEEETQQKHNQIMFRLLDKFALLHAQHTLGDTEVVYNHFEQIQKLNNELINTQRELQRANKKLALLNQELNNRLVKDPLTGLINRYQYRSEMQAAIDRDPQKLGLFAFIDIDDFKQVNDTYGHAVGDEYLIALSHRLASLADIYPLLVMRIAGDEFGLYLHGLRSISNEYVKALADQFTQRVTKERIQTSAGLLPVSCSIGFAVYNRDTSNLFALIDFADWAMYCAKKNGKHTYCLFDRFDFENRFEKS